MALGRRSEDGERFVRQGEALANACIFLGPILIGVPIALASVVAGGAPRVFTLITIGLYYAGFALFLVAKISVLRQGIPLSFGSARMSTWNRRAYRSGYVLMFLGVVATIVVLVLGK